MCVYVHGGGLVCVVCVRVVCVVCVCVFLFLCVCVHACRVCGLT